MNIELTESQCRTLIELVYLGNWIANATRVGDGLLRKYADLEDTILAMAPELGCADLVRVRENGDFFDITRTFETNMHALIDEHEEYRFWEALALKLAERDVTRVLGPVRELGDEVHQRIWNVAEEYHDEFEEHGLKRLVLSKAPGNGNPRRHRKRR